MSRFFISASNLFGGIAWLSAHDEKQMDIIRADGGEVFTVCDGQGTDYIFCGKDAEGSGTSFTGKIKTKGEPALRCTVYAAVTEEKRLRAVIRKCTELGACGFVIFPSARCTTKYSYASLLLRARGWQSIARDAAIESERGIIPRVIAVSSFADALHSAVQTQLPLFLYEEEHTLTFSSAVKQPFSTAAIMTGPELGFTPGEAELAVSSGMISVSIGGRIVGCDTAPISALAALMLTKEQEM